MLKRSVGAGCWREVSEESVVEACCGAVLEKRVGEKGCREALKRSVEEKCWSRVLEKRGVTSLPV